MFHWKKQHVVGVVPYLKAFAIRFCGDGNSVDNSENIFNNPSFVFISWHIKKKITE